MYSILRNYCPLWCFVGPDTYELLSLPKKKIKKIDRIKNSYAENTVFFYGIEQQIKILYI